LERLERQLEGEEAKNRRLEEEQNRSRQEKSHLSATEEDLKKREKLGRQRIEELERELETKNDLVSIKCFTQFLSLIASSHVGDLLTCS